MVRFAGPDQADPEAADIGCTQKLTTEFDENPDEPETVDIGHMQKLAIEFGESVETLQDSSLEAGPLGHLPTCTASAEQGADHRQSTRPPTQHLSGSRRAGASDGFQKQDGESEGPQHQDGRMSRKTYKTTQRGGVPLGPRTPQIPGNRTNGTQDEQKSHRSRG